MAALRNLYNRIPSFLKNKYVLTFLLFLVWMIFFDRNDIITQIKLRKNLRQLERETNLYQEKIKQVRTDKDELLTNKETLEKFAREKYWMKKDNEDIFLIVEE